MGITIIYVSFVNLHVGGFQSFKHFKSEIKKDFNDIIYLSFGKHRLYSYNIKPSPLSYIVDLMFSGFLGLMGIFVFELPYVFLFNYFQFGDWLFPVYTFLGGATLLRNGGLVVLPLIWCVLLYPKMFGFKLKYRLDRFTIILSVACSILFLAWVVYPSGVPYNTPENEGMEVLTIPRQDLFRQTIYPYYNVTLEDPWHVGKSIDAWHQEDPPIHLLNVLAKYMVFLAVGYLFMVRIK